ncbi:hypothetical protein SRHO_G00248440 [Serrasalmus rhombeus]
MNLLMISFQLTPGDPQHYTFVWNPSKQTHDLLVKNVSESDLGLYYCAVQEKKVTKDEAGVIRNQHVYQYGNRTTRLSLLVPCTADIPQIPSTPPASDCSVCWKLLVSVCPVFALLSSTCVYCICRNRFRVIAEEEAGQEWRKNRKTDEVGCVEEHHCERSMNGESCLHTEVCYTSLKSGLKSD